MDVAPQPGTAGEVTVAQQQQRLAFLIFEGGGAKGIAHLGALRAMEDLGYAFAGVAGTSAGAFVAVLVAAGYRSDSLLDPDAPTSNLLAAHGKTPIDLLGAKPWQEMAKLRRAAGRMTKGVVLGGVAGAFATAPVSSMIAKRAINARGHFSTDGVRDFINARLRERLQDLWAGAGKNFEHVPDPVCFADLDFVAFPQLRPLKIIATDVSGMKPVLFDLGGTPGVAVADAVAASLAIPGVFQPVRVRDRTAQGGFFPGLFADGGLVSNLPFWVFNEEKQALERGLADNRPVPVIGFTLVDAPDAPGEVAAARACPVIPLDSFVSNTVRTAIFGSQSIAQSLVRDFTVVKLPARLGVLAFDAPWTAIRADYISGRQGAKRRVLVKLHMRPERIGNWLADIAAGAQTRLATVQHATPVNHIRAYVVEVFGANALRVAQGYNMQTDTDDRLPLDQDSSRGAAVAFRTRDSLVMTLPAGPLPGDRMTKYERVLVRPGLHSVLCVPIFRDEANWLRSHPTRDVPLGVICLDSDEDLARAFSDAGIIQFVIDQSGRFAPIYDME